MLEMYQEQLKDYHYIKPEANMDPSAHLKRKLDAINNILGSLDETEDYLQVRHFKKKQLDVSILILDELEKLDATVLKVPTIITSSDPNSSLDKSNIQHDDGIDEDTWV